VPPLVRRPRRALPLPRIVVAGIAVTLLAAACTASGGSTPTSEAPATSAAACTTDALPGWPQPGQVTTSGIIPVLASSEKITGASRLIFALVDDQNRPVANDKLQVQVAFYDLCVDPANPTEVQTPIFEWGIVGSRAFYVVTPTLGREGPWGAAVAVKDPATGQTTGAKLQFSVSARGAGPRVGDRAPGARTLTLADVGGDVRRVSSDPTPEPSFYETSLDAALAAKQPFVLAFITPGFCRSAQCGPTMEVLKQAVGDAPIRVVAVEPYELAYQGGRLQPVVRNGSFVPVEAANAYAIPTEPWIFVVDGAGTIRGSFEAVVGRGELANAIRAVTK
jgi:hypothetical protein